MEKIWLEHYDPRVAHEIDPDRYSSVVDIFEQSVAKYTDSTAFINMGQSITFTELDRQSKQFAAYLQDCGFKKGDAVAIMMPNLLQYPVAMFGILRAGLSVVNVNPLYTPRELKHQLNDSGAKAIVIVEKLCQRTGRSCERNRRGKSPADQPWRHAAGTKTMDCEFRR